MRHVRPVLLAAALLAVTAPAANAIGGETAGGRGGPPGLSRAVTVR